MTCLGRFLVAGVMAAGFMTNYASATTITSASFNTWKATLTGAPTEADFTKIGLNSYNTPAGITLTPSGNPAMQFTVTGPDGSGYSLSGLLYNGISSLAGASDGIGSIKIVMPGSGENAILIGDGSTPGAPISVTLSDGEAFTISNGLFGLSISHPITWISFNTTSGSRPVLDDFWYGNSSQTQDASSQQDGSSQSVSAVPEAGTVQMIIGGCVLLLGSRRKFSF